MKVKDILEKKGTQVWTVEQKATVHDALGKLMEHRIGALIVLNEKGEVAGIISERDIIRESHRNAHQLDSLKVEQAMSKKLIVGALEDEIDYIMGIMTNNRIRHIPIIHQGKLHGMISIGDVVKAQLQDKEYENRYLKDYIYGRS
jgi:CBS domain-containing protein